MAESRTKRVLSRFLGGGLWLGLALIMVAGGCSTRTPAPPQITAGEQDGPPAGAVDFERIPDAIPRYEPLASGANRPVYEVWGRQYRVLPSNRGYRERGLASWYGTKFHGRPTSIGERFDLYKMTAAHRSLPIPSYAEVRNLDTGKRIVVRINDRGPFIAGRLIDLSYAAAGKLGILEQGTGRVEVRAIDTGQDPLRRVRRAAAPAAPPPVAVPLFVQVGAFDNRYHADRLRRALHKALPHGILVHHQAQARPAYRVRIGPLHSREQADALGVQLAQLGISEYLIITD